MAAVLGQADEQRVAIGGLGRRRDLQLEHVGCGFDLARVEIDAARGGDRRHERGVELERAAVLARSRARAARAALRRAGRGAGASRRAASGSALRRASSLNDLRQAALERGVVAVLRAASLRAARARLRARDSARARADTASGCARDRRSPCSTASPASKYAAAACAIVAAASAPSLRASWRATDSRRALRSALASSSTASVSRLFVLNARDQALRVCRRSRACSVGCKPGGTGALVRSSSQILLHVDCPMPAGSLQRACGASRVGTADSRSEVKCSDARNATLPAALRADFLRHSVVGLTRSGGSAPCPSSCATRSRGSSHITRCKRSSAVVELVRRDAS